MNKLLLMLLLIFPTQTLAEPRIQNRSLLCVDFQQLTEVLDKYKELPTVHGISTSMIDGIARKFSMVIFVNATNRTYTIAEKISETGYCIIAMGDNMEPVPQGMPIQLEKESDEGK